MHGTDDGIEVYNGHYPGPVFGEVGFKDPQAVVWVWVSEGFAELVDKRAFEHLVLQHERKEEMHPRNLQAPYPCDGRSGGDEDAIPAGSCNTAR